MQYIFIFIFRKKKPMIFDGVVNFLNKPLFLRFANWVLGKSDVLKTVVGMPVIQTDKLISLSVLSLVKQTEELRYLADIFMYKMDPNHLYECKYELVMKF